MPALTVQLLASSQNFLNQIAWQLVQGHSPFQFLAKQSGGHGVTHRNQLVSAAAIVG